MFIYTYGYLLNENNFLIIIYGLNEMFVKILNIIFFNFEETERPTIYFLVTDLTYELKKYSKKRICFCSFKKYLL